jgi:MFS family permease
MKAGIACLVLAYVLSQFFRAFLAVLSPILQIDIGAGPDDLAQASGLWFLTFAAMQIPVGMALDRIGPRLTAAVLFAAGGAGGAAVFAAAQGPLGITVAMGLIGVGCSPVLMANYYIFARMFSPAVFGTMAGVVIGIGSLGNIASSLPLAWAVEAIGWRASLWSLAALCLLISLSLLVFLRDPPKLEGQQRGSLMDLLRMPALWLILPIMTVNYLPIAGLRGLWVGPYYVDVFGADAAGIGKVTLLMGLAMVAGNLIYGPLDRVFGTRKWVIFTGNLFATVCLAGLWLFPVTGGWATALLLCGVAFFGASFPMVMAHGRAFFPPHLVGRGVTLFNLFGIGSIAIAQFVTGRLHAASPKLPVETPYTAIFAFYTLVMLAGLIPYFFAQDRTD